MCLHADEVNESIWWLESNEQSSNIFEDIGYYMYVFSKVYTSGGVCQALRCILCLYGRVVVCVCLASCQVYAFIIGFLWKLIH